MQNNEIQKRILQAVESLAKYELDVWEKVGPGVQVALLNSIGALSPEQRDQDRAIVTTVCRAVLSSEIEGATWNANSVTLRTGAVPVGPALVNLRARAIAALFELFKASNSDGQRRKVYSALREAGYVGGRAEISDELLNLTLSNAKQIVEFILEAGPLSYELMQTIEHDYWCDFQRAHDIATSAARAGCREAALQLVEAIEQLRDKFNEDPTFVKFKVLVGFESVFPQQWSERDNGKHDYAALEQYRTEQSAAYVETISDENEAEWFSLIERIASIKSNDLAMFPSFGRFLGQLGSAKPLVTGRLLDVAMDKVVPFLPAIMDGLSKSGDRKKYDEQVERIIRDGTHLAALARHVRIGKPLNVALAERILLRAIETENSVTVAECLILAMESDPKELPPSQLFEPAIRYLNRKEVYWWTRAVWLVPEASAFFAAISGEQARLLLPGLIYAPKIDYGVEQVLVQIARHQLPLVWECLAERLSLDKSKDEGGERYEAVPYRFHGLERELTKDPKLAVEFGRAIFKNDSNMFRFRGGRLLSAAFPSCPPPFADELAELASRGTRQDIEFILAVLENYHGEETTHEVLKRIIVRFPGDQKVQTGVIISLDSTGVVWGEFGFVDAMRGKLAIVREWQNDPRPEVRAFAEAHARNLELRIAQERRRAEEQKALRELEYDDPAESNQK